MRGAFPAIWLSARGVWVVLMLAVLLGLGALVPATVGLFVAALLIAVGATVADALAGPHGRLLRIYREPIGHVALRRDGEVRYVIENRAPLAITIGLVETPVAHLAFVNATTILTVAARATATATNPFTPLERGAATFGDLYAWVENRIGLLRRRYRIPDSETVRVFPDLRAVESYGSLAQRKTLVQAGLRRARLRGSGTEFESLRDYAAGDAFRAVDWNATARRGRLMVAQHEMERSQTIYVALDCGRLMTPRIAGRGALGAQRKFDFALTAALSVAKIAERADDHVGLLAFAARPLVEIPPRRGSAHIAAMARIAYDLQPRFEEPDYETTFATLRRRATKRSLMILFTDIFDPLTSAAVLAGVGSLVARHLVLCVFMNDAQIGRALDTTPTTANDAYRTAVAMSLADERAKAISVMRSRGIIVIDVPAPALTVALLDAYLDIKARGAL